MKNVEPAPLSAVKEYPYGRRGFASMPLEQRREIASLGGKAVPQKKRAYSQDRELAVRAGRLGRASQLKP
jgi:general stress protein YciG